MSALPNPQGPGPSLFGQVRLGYLLVHSLQLDAWERFGAEGLGLHVERPHPHQVVFRIDGWQRRLVIAQGPAENVAALGWQFEDEGALSLALRRLQAMGATPSRLNDEQAALRGIEQGWTCEGPKRMALELFTLPRLGSTPLQMRATGFETGAGGLGHLALTSREPEAMQRFWQQWLDARVSDTIVDRMTGVDMDFTFLRVNERHHTVAIASTRKPRLDPLRTHIHHLNLQTASFDDVAEGYRRCRALGYPIANAIGQHPNDKELSFYVETPSGFAIELGWNPLIVTAAEEAHWQHRQYEGISLWGHFNESASLGQTLGQFARGLRSLRQPEHTLGR